VVSKKFVYLLSDLEPSQIEDLSVEIKTFLHEQVRIAYDLKEARLIKSNLLNATS